MNIIYSYIANRRASMKKLGLTNWFVVGAEILGLITIILTFVIPNYYTTFRLLMTLLFMALALLPKLVQWIFHFSFPNYINIIYISFLVLSTLIGTIYRVYDYISFYDTILHSLSGVLLGAFGLYLITALNRDVRLNRFGIFLFIIGCAILVGVLWEFWEYSTDGLLGLNSQNHADINGVEYIGRAALQDTMLDLFADFGGALLFGIVYLIFGKKFTHNDKNTQNNNIDNPLE